MIHQLQASHQIDLPRHASFLGGKASSLVRLLQGGLSVPPGIILDSRIFREELRLSGKLDQTESVLARIGVDGVGLCSEKLSEVWADYRISNHLALELQAYIDPAKTYAVRSSAMLEDLASASFAGQYETSLRLNGIEEISEGIKQCYRSLYSERSLAYVLKKKSSFRLEDLSMAVIIQEMVDAKASGVLFTAHPLEGTDQVMAVELSKGTAEHLVAGQIKPIAFVMPWFDELSPEAIEEADSIAVSSADLYELRKQSLDAARLFGYPLDIEFAFEADGQLRMLQARPITSFRYQGISGQWTTADFKDGGVSAGVCRQYMWSLYELAWENSLSRFLREGRLLDPPPEPPYARLLFGRPYWNLDIVKMAMRKVPGFKERSFDADYGINGSYEEDGEITAVNPKNLLRFLPIAFAQNKLLKQREAESPTLRDELLEQIASFHRELDDLSADSEMDTVAALWTNIHFDCYLACESSYFWQIFLNTIHQTRTRDQLLKYMDDAAYLTLLGGLDEVSHLLPFYALWDISREIRSNPGELGFWRILSEDELLLLFNAGQDKKNHFTSLRLWLEDYGYHSAKELDVSWPNYAEDPSLIIHQLKETVEWPDELGPQADKEAAHASYDQAIAGLREKLGDRKTKQLERKIEHMRSLLWWREEFRDVSTRCYDLVRKAALIMGDRLQAAGVLEAKEDIWQLKIGQIQQYLTGQIDGGQLRLMIAQAMTYYEAHSNYLGDNEIPAATMPLVSTGNFSPVPGNGAKPGEILKVRGIPAGSGSVRGTARVIHTLDEIDRLQAGDILVTRFTDTGWTVKFAVLAGIVTEYGGVLSHAAIVSREYGIPCVVGASFALEEIADGEEIFLDGSLGRVWQSPSEVRGLNL